MSVNAKSNKRRNAYFAKPLQQFVEPLLRPLFKDRGAAAVKIIKEWENIVGKELSQHCLPDKITFPKNKNNCGTLRIMCEGVYALTLQHMQPVIIERIAGYFGYRAVERIVIEQSRSFISAPSPADSERLSKKISASLLNKTDYLSAIEKNKIADSELEAALSSLAKTISLCRVNAVANETS